MAKGCGVWSEASNDVLRRNVLFACKVPSYQTVSYTQSTANVMSTCDAWFGMAAV